jgi:hypothetical protein
MDTVGTGGASKLAPTTDKKMTPPENSGRLPVPVSVAPARTPLAAPLGKRLTALRSAHLASARRSDARDQVDAAPGKPEFQALTTRERSLGCIRTVYPELTGDSPWGVAEFVNANAADLAVDRS